jgi:hypothetical protein
MLVGGIVMAKVNKQQLDRALYEIRRAIEKKVEQYGKTVCKTKDFTREEKWEMILSGKVKLIDKANLQSWCLQVENFDFSKFKKEETIKKEKALVEEYRLELETYYESAKSELIFGGLESVRKIIADFQSMIESHK